jgi:GDPmannose 4,6-dehydratase
VTTALVTGISGQDGSYLAELLLDQGYDVHGLVRGDRLGLAEHLRNRITSHSGDLRDADSLLAAVRDSRPDEVYHLGAATHAGRSADDPEGVRDVVARGTERLLEAVASKQPTAKVFCASSAEVFGSPAAAPQTEETPAKPRNPYGEAKAEALELARHFRADRALWVSVGILYNHESPRRPLSFVTRKVTWHAAAIARGKADELRIGNLDARRDWGYAPEYMEGVRRTLQHDEPTDFVLATGVLHTVRELVEAAFDRAGVPTEGHVVVDPAFVRPDEAVPLVGDPRKARDTLGWVASTPFVDVIAEMVDADLEALGR